MALYLLNISVDSHDLNPEPLAINLSINEQESIVEIVVEQILGFENAIAENDDHDQQQHKTKKNSKIDVVILLKTTLDCPDHFVAFATPENPENSDRLKKGYFRTDDQPPRV